MLVFEVIDIVDICDFLEGIGVYILSYLILLLSLFNLIQTKTLYLSIITLRNLALNVLGHSLWAHIAYNVDIVYVNNLRLRLLAYVLRL